MADPKQAELRTGAVLSTVPLIAVLCAIAGSVDAIAYLLFGRVFIANMTGNTVLFAVSLLGREWVEAGLRLGIILAFLAGVLLARAGLCRLVSGSDRGTKLTALGIELLVLGATAWVTHPSSLHVLLLLLLAASLGLQNDAFQAVGIVKVNTTFITGDLENLGAALAESRTSEQRRAARLRVAVFLCTWVGYGAGALAGALAVRHLHGRALLLPACLVAVAAALLLRSPEKYQAAPREAGLDRDFRDTPHSSKY